MRGVAIGLVFFYHCFGIAFGIWGPGWKDGFLDFNFPQGTLGLFPCTYGWSGVAIFFAISGFCIHLSRQRLTGWWEFFTRRFFRIYPPYLLALLIVVLIPPLSDFQLNSLAGYKQMVVHLLFIHNLSPYSRWAISGPFWSVAVEFQLYLVYPALLFLVSRIGWRWVLGTTLLIEASLRLAGPWLPVAGASGFLYNLLAGSPLGFWFSWAIGAWVADCYIRGIRIPCLGATYWLWLALFLLSGLVKPLNLLGFPLAALFAASWIAVSLGRSAAASRFPLARHLSWVGTVSYSLYLLHQPFLEMIAGWLRPGVAPLPVFAVLALCWLPLLAIAAVYHRGVELPSIALGKRWAARFRGGEPASV